MNTLILDLVNQINQHLTDVEDVFINHQDHVKIENMKVAVRSRNWKAILYYIERDRAHRSTMCKLYYAACQIGDVGMMNKFNPEDRLNEQVFKIKYLAKGRQYDLLEQHLKGVKARHQYEVMGMITLGLLINGDTDLILSNKYCDYNKLLNSNYGHVIKGEYVYRSYKYRRFDILEAFNLKDDPTFSIESALGKIRAGECPIIGNYMFAYTREKLMRQVCKYGTDEYINSQVAHDHKNIGSLELIQSGRVHLFKDYVQKGYISKREAVDAAIEADNVELFSLYYQKIPKTTYADLIDKTIRKEAICVLKFLLDAHPRKHILFFEHVGEGYLHITDYKIANMLMQEITNGRKINGFLELINNTVRAGYNFF